jgi:rhodanese-related sulfurtransferase
VPTIGFGKEDVMTSVRMMLPVALLSLLAVPAPAQTAPAPAAMQPAVPLIEPAQLKGLMALGTKLTIVDVRRPDETALGTIKGAILMPLDNLPNTYSSLPKKGRLIVYCRSGHRSAQAVQFLIEHGYRNAVSLDGGYTAWTKQ